MKVRNDVVSYQMELTPLLNQKGDIVLLYLKDDINYLLRDKNQNFFNVFPKISIEYYKFLKENQLIDQIRDTYQMMKETDDVDMLRESESMEKYIDSFMKLEYVTEDITNEGVLSINHNESSFIWIITQPEWIAHLSNNQYKIMVNLTFREDK